MNRKVTVDRLRIPNVGSHMNIPVLIRLKKILNECVIEPYLKLEYDLQILEL